MNKNYTEEMFTNACPFDNPYQGKGRRMLFVCSAGMLRSPTAAKVAIGLGYNARSCGSHEEYALIPLSANLITWAESIFFVNEENFDRACQTFYSARDILSMLQNKSEVWDLEDVYEYNSPTLVTKITKLLA